jgi:ubiquinone/menaquinone biosynthesis C-methylase UbiE
MPQINAQLNFASPESLAIRLSLRVRRRMFRQFMREFRPNISDTILDVGVTSDRSYASSNYFEGLYPFKSNVIAVGLDDASFLETTYPGVRFVFASGMMLPFRDSSFDLVHSSAVWEHVGSFENQGRLLSECLRVARRGVCLTTPNRWHPIEFHTQLPLIHWLPKRLFRSLLAYTRFRELADEAKLNLLSEREIRTLAERHPEWTFSISSERVLGWKSNLICFAHRRRDETYAWVQDPQWGTASPMGQEVPR